MGYVDSAAEQRKLRTQLRASQSQDRNERLSQLSLTELKAQNYAESQMKMTVSHSSDNSSNRFGTMSSQQDRLRLPLERQANLIHSRLVHYLKEVQQLDKQTLKRYKRLALHLYADKHDPLKLDQLKYAFLERAEHMYDPISITVAQFREVFRKLTNSDLLKNEDRFIQALAEEGTDEKSMVKYSSLQRFIDVYYASSMFLNERVADLRRKQVDPISGHLLRDMMVNDRGDLLWAADENSIRIKKGSLSTENAEVARCLMYLW